MRYNETLKQKHESLRQETIQSVQEAIEDIRATEGEHSPITAKKLLEYTELSRGTLYKEHVLKVWNYKLWEEKHVLRTKIEKQVRDTFNKDLESYSENLFRLETELEKANNKIKNLEKKLDKEKMKSIVYKDDLNEEKIKVEKALGECQRLHGILKAHGINPTQL